MKQDKLTLKQWAILIAGLITFPFVVGIAIKSFYLLYLLGYNLI